MAYATTDDLETLRDEVRAHREDTVESLLAITQGFVELAGLLGRGRSTGGNSGSAARESGAPVEAPAGGRRPLHD
jgi:hypothetical protein